MNISDLFTDYFEESYTSLNWLTETYPYTIIELDIFSSVAVLEYETFETLSGLNESWLPGPVDIPSCVLQRCADLLCVPLTGVFNSKRKGYFPTLNLLVLTGDSFILFEEFKQTSLIYTDFAKAFDKMNPY